ncbi:MAG: DUF1579 domain-containing protein [Phycisphaerales bacterium]|nr:DUF1579 domain-containing protein [Phycisphaerales bacterium]
MGEVTTKPTEDCAAMSGTTEAHARFKPFVGTFKGRVQMWMGPGDPMVSTGTMVNTLELGGRYLHHNYKGDPNPGPFGAFEGRGYWGYNTADNRYEGFWIDNACTIMQSDHGQVDASGKTWTMIGSMTNPQTGQPLKKKSVITLRDADHHTMEMFFDAGDGAWHRSMLIEYTRA